MIVRLTPFFHLNDFHHNYYISISLNAAQKSSARIVAISAYKFGLDFFILTYANYPFAY